VTLPNYEIKDPSLAEFGRQRIEWASEVTAYQANRKVEFKIDAGPLMLKESLAFEPLEGGTRVTLADQGEPGGFVGVPKRIAVRIWKRQVEGNLAKLKDILEAQAEAAG